VPCEGVIAGFSHRLRHLAISQELVHGSDEIGGVVDENALEVVRDLAEL
jgi:hypothetical protein